MRHILLLVAFLSALPAFAQDEPSPVAGTFKITFDPTLQAAPYSGRVYIALSKSKGREPRLGMGNWFGKSPLLALDVKDVASGGSVVVDGKAIGWPKALNEVEPADYTAQAIARRSLDSPDAGTGPGDLYSEPVRITFKPGDTGVVEFKLTKVVEGTPFKESDRVKEVSFVSPLLSKFYGREVKANAAVILPRNWKDDPSVHYPTVYFIGGFGSDHRSAQGMTRMLPKAADDCLVVIPDPSCSLGHSVFADSANNGPRGQSLIEEIIPAVETKYHGASSAATRWVTGISSGGWSCLWLIVTYPDSFGQCWSFCPDPVDFRDFQKIDLYAPNANMYKDETGTRRPLARQGQNVMAYYDDFCHQEWVLGHGGQIHSFEAVFSPRGPDGKPQLLFDRDTGNVNPATAKTWEKYDIRLILERNWATLGPKLKGGGKLRIYAGEFDTFYLEGAVRLLEASLTKLGSDANIKIVPGMAHAIPPGALDEMFKLLNPGSPEDAAPKKPE